MIIEQPTNGDKPLQAAQQRTEELKRLRVKIGRLEAACDDLGPRTERARRKLVNTFNRWLRLSKQLDSARRNLARARDQLPPKRRTST